MYEKLISNYNNKGGNMTEKELLYLEDAIEHEKSIIGICNDLSLKVSDEFKNYFSDQISLHSNIIDNLMNLAKEKANE